MPQRETGSAQRPSLQSLDDIIALLVQLEPADLQELTQVREALSYLATGEKTKDGHSYSPTARELIAAAAYKLTEILQETSQDTGKALEEVGQLLETALEVGSVAQDPEESTLTKEEKSTCALPIGDPSPLESLPLDADPELLGEFIIEGREYIEAAEAALLSLETNPEDMDAVNTVFRAFHTIKGTAAFLGLTRLSNLAHHAESLLSRVREREIRYTGIYADLALRSVDMLKALLQATQDALGGTKVRLPSGLGKLMEDLAHPDTVSPASPCVEVPPPPRLGDLLVAQNKVSREEIESIAIEQGTHPIGMTLVKSGTASLTDVAQALRMQQRLVNAEPRTDSSVRVRTDRLDRLIDLVGELVIAQSMVVQDQTIREGSHYALIRKVTHCGKLIRELQDLSMSMRMVPLKTIFQKMTRLIRDLAQKSGKSVELVIEGEDTELDRHMVDTLNDPLIHMVRNAVDHGIEPPDVREQRGKPRSGTIRLAAYHASGNVIVELQDDGKGLDREKILQKALDQGIIESGKGLADSEVFALIFVPGFSTAEQVTDVSGRGVGMDVVKRQVEGLRGRIDITSLPGQGTTFTLTVPLTLAITDGMLVRVGTERYIIPTVNITLSFRPTSSDLFTVVGRGELVRLREELLPLWRLHRIFQIPGAVEDPTHGLVVVVNEGEQRGAILVDELLGQQQVVVKAIGTGIGKIPGIAGGAILGDGRVGLILDPIDLVSPARHAQSKKSSERTAGYTVAS